MDSTTRTNNLSTSVVADTDITGRNNTTTNVDSLHDKINNAIATGNNIDNHREPSDNTNTSNISYHREIEHIIEGKKSQYY